MMRKTHLLVGCAGAALLFSGADYASLGLAIGGAAVGSYLPDLDLSFRIKHRTVTHWLIWPALLWLFSPWAALTGLAVGWALHILADCLTVEGLAPFWPLTFRIRGPVKAGGFTEYLFLSALSVLVGVYFL